MEIVKRGKVSYLFERFVDELQIQTLLLLLRGGNLEVKAQMKYHVEKWGKARYGEKVWPLRVQDEIPALFIGMSGIDEEFRNREIFAEKMLYDTRLNSILDTLGQRDERFRRQRQGLQQRLSDPLSRHVGHQRGAARRTTTRKNGPRPQGVPGIGTGEDLCPRRGLALGRGHEGRRRRAVADQRRHPRRDQRRRQAGPVDQGDRRRSEPAVAALARLGRRSRRQHRPRAPRDGRQEGRRMAHRRRGRIYHRVHALEESLCMAEGEELQIADCADNANRRHGDPLPKELKNYLHEWATVAVPKRWETFCNDHHDGEPWLDPNDMNLFTRYLRDYLLTDKVFGNWSRRCSRSWA